MASGGWQDPVQRGGGGGMQFAMPPLTPVVKVLILANAAVFGLTVLLDLFSPGAWHTLQGVFGVSPGVWSDWFPFLPVWQLLSYGFLHDTSQLTHILFNMLFLYFLGTMLEAIVGGRRFLVTYVGGIVVGGASMLLLGLATGDPRPTIGASGAVLCIVVATAVLRPETRMIFILFPVTLRTVALIYVGINVFGVLQDLRGGAGGVAHTAHLSGAAYGFLVAKSGWIWRDPIAAWRERSVARAREREAMDSGHLDEILSKIHRDGIQSLSPRERVLLKRMSKRP